MILPLLYTARADLVSELHTRPVVHPSLLLGEREAAALFMRQEGKGVTADVAKRVIALSDGIAELPLPKRELEGIRLLQTSRMVLKRVLACSMSWLLTHDRKHVDTARRTMLAAADFADWNPSHFLDAAEMTAALAIGYDWLYDELSTEDRTKIREAIVTKGLQPSLTGGWWVDSDNNWNQVCHGGLVLGALAVRDEDPGLARQILERALEKLPIGMAVYAPDGAYPEGPSYWDFGTTYNVLLIAALESALGSDGGLFEQPGFAQTGDYVVHTRGPTGMLFNYSDGNRGSPADVNEALFWFAGRLDQPALVERQWDAVRLLLAAEPEAGDNKNRFFPLLLLWGENPAPLEAEDPFPLSYRSRGINPIAVHRSGWDGGATWFGIKAGSPSVNHGHMDIGSVVVEAKGRRWIEDLGRENYGRLESNGLNIWDRSQDSDRWTVLRHHNRAHSTLLVDGRGQVVSGDAPILSSSAEGSERHTLVDMSPVYRGQLDKVLRGVLLTEEKGIVIRDEFNGPAGRNVRFGLVTMAKPSVVTPRLLKLEQAGETVLLRIDSPDEAVWTIGDLQPERSFEDPNDGASLLSTTVKTDGGDQAIQVSMHPGEPTPERTTALADW